MPNDLPDWTAQLSVNLVAASGALEGDVSGAGLAADSVTETIQPSQPLTLGSHIAILGSLKAAAGQAIAQVGALGARADGTNVAVNPAFGQATVAGHCLVAWVSAVDAAVNTVSAGWSALVGSGPGPHAEVVIFIKPNCGAAEAPPQFTAPGGTSPMRAVLGEFSGVATVAPTDQTVGGGIATSPGTITAAALDTAFGELVLFAFGWQLTAPGTATFSDAMNNRAAVVGAGSDGTLLTTVKYRFGYGITVAPTAALPLGVQQWPYDASGVSEPAAGSAASVVLAAAPGKAYTCAYRAGSLIATTAAAQTLRFQLLDGVAVKDTHLLAVPAGIGNSAQLDQSTLAFKGVVGNSMTWASQAPAAGGQVSAALGVYLR